MWFLQLQYINNNFFFRDYVFSPANEKLLFLEEYIYLTFCGNNNLSLHLS